MPSSETASPWRPALAATAVASVACVCACAFAGTRPSATLLVAAMPSSEIASRWRVALAATAVASVGAWLAWQRRFKKLRKGLAITNGVLGHKDIRVYVSFPGIYEDEWNEMVAKTELLKRLDPDSSFLSTACIYLPAGDENYGQHSDNVVDGTGRCYCYKIYGSRKEWGCRWFELWRRQLHRALDLRQRPVVVYKHNEVGMGDEATWDQFPIPFNPNRPGLGGSQVSEVAYLRKVAGDTFEKKDVKAVTEDIWQQAVRHMHRLLQGEHGARRLAEAVLDCSAAQQGLRRLSLNNVRMGEQGAEALAEALPKLEKLSSLDLRQNNLGTEGAKAIFAVLPAMARLEELDLRDNCLENACAGPIAAALPLLASLRDLDLRQNHFCKGSQAKIRGAARRFVRIRFS